MGQRRRRRHTPERIVGKPREADRLRSESRDDEAYAEMRERLGPGRKTTLLYRDYLRRFRRRSRPRTSSSKRGSRKGARRSIPSQETGLVAPPDIERGESPVEYPRAAGMDEPFAKAATLPTYEIQRPSEKTNAQRPIKPCWRLSSDRVEADALANGRRFVGDFLEAARKKRARTVAHLFTHGGLPEDVGGSCDLVLRDERLVRRLRSPLSSLPSLPAECSSVWPERSVRGREVACSNRATPTWRLAPEALRDVIDFARRLRRHEPGASLGKRSSRQALPRREHPSSLDSRGKSKRKTGAAHMDARNAERVGRCSMRCCRLGLQSGLSLLEVVFVLVLLGLLTAVVLPRFFASSEKAEDTVVQSNLRLAYKAIEADRVGGSGGNEESFPPPDQIATVITASEPQLTTLLISSPSAIFDRPPSHIGVATAETDELQIVLYAQSETGQVYRLLARINQEPEVSVWDPDPEGYIWYLKAGIARTAAILPDGSTFQIAPLNIEGSPYEAQLRSNGDEIVLAGLPGAPNPRGPAIFDTDGNTQIIAVAGYTGHAGGAALAPNGNFVVFSSDADLLGTNPEGDFELYRVNRNGTGLTQLTSNGAAVDDKLPVISPNGSRIAYIRAFSGQTDIAVMNADGSSDSNITSSMDKNEANHAWINNNSLLYTDNGDTGVGPANDLEVYRMNANGSAKTLVLDDNGTIAAPRLSSGGTAFLFINRDASQGNVGDLHSYNISSSTRTTIAAPPMTGDPQNDYIASYDWSRDDAFVAWSDGLGDLWYATRNGTDEQLVAGDVQHSFGVNYPISWSR
jgi:type II secretory pathway pseudopilin PulG